MSRRQTWRRLARASSGVAATEFALVLPFLLSISLFGLELAHQAITQMQLSQLAMRIADDASRIGDTATLEDRKIYESDINDLFTGADLQGGRRIDLFRRGRVILSSLEVVPGTEDQQYIHWQRCLGAKNVQSSYGVTGDGLGTPIPGIGPAGHEVTAFQDDGVMFVEVVYDYKPLIGDAFALTDRMSATASFTIRDDRDLTRIYQRDEGSPDPVAGCDDYGERTGASS